MFDDVQTGYFISFVHSEQFDCLQEAEDGGTTHDVPGKNGPGPGQVPEQHHEGVAGASVDQTCRLESNDSATDRVQRRALRCKL